MQLMSFDKDIYEKKYFIEAIKNVESDYDIKIDWEEKENYFEVRDTNIAIKVADYYIYIYNENN